MVQITPIQRREKRNNEGMGKVLGDVGAVAGGIIGGIYSGGAGAPAGAAAGAAMGNSLGGMVGGMVEGPEKPIVSSGAAPTNPTDRRIQAQDGDSYGQLKQGLMASANLPPDQRAEHAPVIMQAMQKMVVG